MDMSREHAPSRPPAPAKYLRVIGGIWAVLVTAILIGALLAPHMSRMTDFVLLQTSHRQWVRFTLNADQPLFDLSTPLSTVKSYYSALYRGNTTRMAALTQEPLRSQMRERLRYRDTSTISDDRTYQSFLRTQQTEQQTVVMEKFHLFWKRGLRFHLQRHAAGWVIVRVDML